MKTPSVDVTNLLLVIFSCMVGHMVPAELLVFSYAFLGPLHYLTEISWLHDRQYFTGKRSDAIPLAVLCLGILVSETWAPFITMLLFFLAVSMPFTRNWTYRLGACLLATAVFIVLNEVSFSSYFFLLLPTLVHVFVFTALFVLLGALRSKSIYGYLTLVSMTLGALSFWVIGSAPLVVTNYGAENLPHLKNLYHIFFTMIGVDETSAMTRQVIGFFGFVYTYHYLNWFSKTRVIGWNNITMQRRALILGIYALAIGVYLYDYALGFKLLLLLSLLHVVLEFPLNGLSIAQIGKQLAARLR